MIILESMTILERVKKNTIIGFQVISCNLIMGEIILGKHNDT